MTNELKLLSLTIEGKQLGFSVSCGGEVYNNTYEYEDVDFDQLVATFGFEAVERICFHIVAFEAVKYCSLAPSSICFGDWQKYCTADFFEFWQTILKNVFAQWRYENNLPHYKGPSLLSPEGAAAAYSSKKFPAPISQKHELDYLVFCGGGKDSLVAMRTLDAVGQGYGTFVYTHSIYGDQQQQVSLNTQMAGMTGSKDVHIQHVVEDFLGERGEDHMARLGVKTMLGAETPSSIFAALPIMLAKKYRCVVLGHERSADVGNLMWEETGEEVNHQWGKSWEAELLINTYVADNLLSGYSYFSILKPLTDVAILGLLSQHTDAVAKTHSCNVDKPWCKKCAKCAYVWLSMKAYLPNDVVDGIFQADLFDFPENEIWFRRLLGLGEHTPFECVGQISESRLALALYLTNNEHVLARQLMGEFEEDFVKVIHEFTKPYYEDSNLDELIKQEVIALYDQNAQNLRETLLKRLT